MHALPCPTLRAHYSGALTPWAHNCQNSQHTTQGEPRSLDWFVSQLKDLSEELFSESATLYSEHGVALQACLPTRTPQLGLPPKQTSTSTTHQLSPHKHSLASPNQPPSKHTYSLPSLLTNNTTNAITLQPRLPAVVFISLVAGWVSRNCASDPSKSLTCRGASTAACGEADHQGVPLAAGRAGEAVAHHCAHCAQRPARTMQRDAGGASLYCQLCREILSLLISTSRKV